jgi:hypothetical protein
MTNPERLMGAMEDNVAASLEVLETVERRFGRRVRDDSARVLVTSMRLALVAGITCGSLDPEIPEEMKISMQQMMLSVVKGALVTQLYLLTNGHRLNEQDAMALTQIIASQVEHGLMRLNATIDNADD